MKRPTNRISDRSERGIMVRRLASHTETHETGYTHKDDYYIFCLLQRGTIRMSVDFEEGVIGGHTVACLMPGQAHRILEMKEAEGYLLFIDTTLIGDENQGKMRQYAFTMHPLPTDEQRENELATLFPMLLHRIQTSRAKDFARVIVDIFMEIFSANYNNSSIKPRHREILISFCELLERHIIKNRQPKFYADYLNITTGYLNEILIATIGCSTSRYIRREIVLRIKRALVCSTSTSKEIAYALGFDDHAYFSRLFAKEVGITPSKFRSRYHD